VLTPRGIAEELAVIIEIVRPADLAPVIMLAYGVSQREREVTSLVLYGLSTQEIAKRLRLSPYTIQDHLKAIFEKVGVRSRRELAGQIFREQFWPRFESEESGDVMTGALAGLLRQA
jgi:DNA-binding CsgD family transcriptional regulator